MIQRYVVPKDFRYGWFLEDRLPGAFRFAGSAVYAFIRMDVELIGKCVFVFAHVLVDAVYGTYADTSRVEAITAKAIKMLAQASHYHVLCAMREGTRALRLFLLLWIFVIETLWLSMKLPVRFDIL
jgi:hypothetical protein